jgi:hypothetical protein
VRALERERLDVLLTLLRARLGLASPRSTAPPPRHA